MTELYRPCVVAVVEDGQGRYLVGERSDSPGSWQLPQGGIDPGEEARAAVMRELSEETGCPHLEIIRAADQLVRYRFPPNLANPKMKQWAGQEQAWYLLRFTQGGQPNLARSDGEFRDFAWRHPADIISGIIDWKQAAYRQGFAALGLI